MKSVWILDAGYSILDTGCSILDAGCSILDTGCSILDISWCTAQGLGLKAPVVVTIGRDFRLHQDFAATRWLGRQG